MPRKPYRVGPATRLANRLFMALAQRARGPSSIHVATFTGRHSGLPRQVPLHVIVYAGQRWTVAIYGERGWVHNARAHPSVTLRRGAHHEEVQFQEVDAVTGGPVLQHYVDTIPHVRPYLHLGDDSSSATWQNLVKTHPVFHLSRPSL